MSNVFVIMRNAWSYRELKNCLRTLATLSFQYVANSNMIVKQILPLCGTTSTDKISNSNISSRLDGATILS